MKAKTKTKRAKNGQKGSKLWMVVTGLMCLTAVFPGYGLAALVWLAPLFVLRALRPDRGEPAILAALFFIASTLMHPACALLQTGGGWAEGMAISLNVHTLSAAYAAAAAAWLISEAATLLARWSDHKRRTATVARLQQEAKSLREEWQMPQAADGVARAA